MAVVDLLLEAQSAIGATLVVVTHDLEVAARLERVVSLRDGRVVDDQRGKTAGTLTSA